VKVNSGPQYHIAHIAGDGGPLLAGRNLSSVFGARPGDVANPVAYGPLEGKLRSLYWHSGYADAEVKTDRVLDRELKPEQESRVRELFTNLPGEVFDQMAINNLYRSVHPEPLLTGMSFTFSPKRDKTTAAVDLTLDFYKEGTETHVTVN
jgi:hypothetical protein